MNEDQVLEKYETEFSQYCFDELGITNGEVYLAKLENGEFWDWLGEYHPEELEELDRQDREKSGIVYDPPMSQTDEYLLKKQREEEYKSYEY